MPLTIEKGEFSMYRSEERLLLTADGKVVKGDDPTGVTLLVAVGGEIPYPDAIKYGLVADPKAPQAPEAKSTEKAALPLPSTAEAVEKAADVLPKGVATGDKSMGTETKAAAKETPKPEKK